MHTQDPSTQLSAFIDANWARDPSDCLSWIGHTFFLNGLPITWCVVKQTYVAVKIYYIKI